MAEDTAAAVATPPKSTKSKKLRPTDPDAPVSPRAAIVDSKSEAKAKSEVKVDPDAPADQEEGFADPITRPDSLGQAKATNTDADAEDTKSKTPQLVKDVAKLLGLKRARVIGYNEQTGVVVTDDGGKYQLSKNGKALRHLAGPRPPEDAKTEVVDARTRSVFTGTAAALNSSVHEGVPSDALQARKAALEAELAEVNEQLEE